MLGTAFASRPRTLSLPVLRSAAAGRTLCGLAPWLAADAPSEGMALAPAMLARVADLTEDYISTGGLYLTSTCRPTTRCTLIRDWADPCAC